MSLQVYKIKKEKKMKKRLLFLVGLLFAMEAEARCKGGVVTYDITTGSKTGTYYQIGLNLAKYVAPNACIKLNVLTSNGSLENAFKLNSKNNIKFAIVQNDVLQELKRLSKEEGNNKATNLVKNLRVIAPLYREEIHIISKVNSDINSFGDLRDKRIAIGKKKSGTAMTSYLLYEKLFGEKLKKGRTQSFNESLKDLDSGHIDAIIKVAGQPVMRLSKNMNKNSSKYIKLLSYNEKNPTHNPIESYYTSDIRASSYPWLDNDVATLSTKSYLITYNYTNGREKKYIKQFIESFNKNLSLLQSKASSSSKTPHLKWKEVSSSCESTLPGGWKYYKVVDNLCGGVEIPTSIHSSGCSQRDIDLGLCGK